MLARPKTRSCNKTYAFVYVKMENIGIKLLQYKPDEETKCAEHIAQCTKGPVQYTVKGDG